MASSRPFGELSVEAEHASVCVGCGDSIRPGDEIEFDESMEAWVHDGCADDTPNPEDDLWRL